MCVQVMTRRKELSAADFGTEQDLVFFVFFLYFDYAIYLRVFATEGKQESGSEFQDGKVGVDMEKER
jgi:hypothetical protein